MSSFFTLPASVRKRKRPENDAIEAKNRRPRPSAHSVPSGRRKRAQRDESISGSESGSQSGDSDPEQEFSDAEDGSSNSSHDGETGAERRLRLAERYLESIRKDVQQAGFDAEEVDRDLISERLKEDVAESKGRMYRFVAQDYDYVRATQAHFRFKTDCVTSVAVCSPYAYTVSRDMRLTKWELPEPRIVIQSKHRKPRRGSLLPRQRPKKLLATRGNRHGATDSTQKHHTGPILCVAASPDGRFIATGGQDKRVIIWSSSDLSPLRVFSQHRDIITSVAIQNGLNRLYSASNDRTIKTWGLNELAYIETLFGHQDHVVDVAALPQERCLSAGARDRTVRLWKVVDETQLVFRGGGTGERRNKSSGPTYPEGSIDRVAMIDDDTFVTGSDNGALALWSIHKKKPIHYIARAHGCDPPLALKDAFAERDLTGRVAPAPPQPRWITALATVPYSDLVLSGSWDGRIRVWRVSEDRRRLEPVAAVGCRPAVTRSTADKVLVAKDIAKSRDANHHGDNADDETEDGNEDTRARGIVNDLAIYERGERGGQVLCVVAALGKQHRLGRWMGLNDGKNGAIVFEIPQRLVTKRKKVARDQKVAPNDEP